MSVVQGRRKVRKSRRGGGSSNLVGIICPLVEIGLTVTLNLGKAWALEALVAVVPLLLILKAHFCEPLRKSWVLKHYPGLLLATIQCGSYK